MTKHSERKKIGMKPDILGWIKTAELMQVLHQQKPLMRTGITENEREYIEEFCQEYNLAFEKSEFKVALLDGDKPYSHKGEKIAFNDPRPGMVFYYISSSSSIAKVGKAAEDRNDSREFGTLLGYPACCIQFYMRKEAMKATEDNDFTALSMENAPETIPWQMNITKKENDACLLSHFPCHMACLPSQKMAEQAFNLLHAYVPDVAEVWRQELQKV